MNVTLLFGILPFLGGCHPTNLSLWAILLSHDKKQSKSLNDRYQQDNTDQHLVHCLALTKWSIHPSNIYIIFSFMSETYFYLYQQDWISFCHVMEVSVKVINLKKHETVQNVTWYENIKMNKYICKSMEQFIVPAVGKYKCRICESLEVVQYSM